MINLQAEYQKYCDQARECAAFLDRYRDEEWEALPDEIREKEREDFLAAQEAYRIPFAWLERKCWMKRALTLSARMWYVEEECSLEETMERMDRFLEQITEAFIRVFPDREKLVNRKKEKAADYFRELRRKYQWRRAQNGYYRMILDANGWDDFPADTQIVLPTDILRLAGTEPELVLLALLYHYRSEDETMLINQGDFGNWFAYSSGKGGEQRLSDLAEKWPQYVTQTRAGIETNAPSRFRVEEPLTWREGEPGIRLEDDGAHSLANQLLAFANAMRLFPDGSAGFSDGQLEVLMEIAKANPGMGRTRCPGEEIRLVKVPEEAGFYLTDRMAEQVGAAFGASVFFGGRHLKDLRLLPEPLWRRAFAESWAAAEWLNPPYRKKLSEEGKALNLQQKQSEASWKETLVLLAHEAGYKEGDAGTGKGKYHYQEREAISPEQAAAFGDGPAREALLDRLEELAGRGERIRIRFRGASQPGCYRYAVVTESIMASVSKR